MLAAPRVYKLPDGSTLTETGLPMASGFELSSGGMLPLADDSVIEPRTFELRGASGVVSQRYGHPTSYALDDYLYVWELYYVQDGALCGATAAFGRRWECKLSSQRVELTGLELISGS